MAEQPRRRTARIVTRRFASSQEADRHDLEFWMQIPESERVLQVWRLSQELWRLRGELRDEPGLCRSVARVIGRSAFIRNKRATGRAKDLGDIEGM